MTTTPSDDPDSPDAFDIEDVLLNLEEANEAAKQLGDEYGSWADTGDSDDSDENDENQEELTSDGRLVLHVQDEEGETGDIRVEIGTLEVPAREGDETREGQT